jgi:hypothetical protein
MDITFMSGFAVPVIIGLCLCVGYIVKHWINDVDNKIIPTLCAIVGVAVAMWMNWGNITPEVILQGLASGLASTGLHQAVKQWLGTA